MGNNGPNLMPKWIRTLYMCYLGKDMAKRLGAICDFLKTHDGESFFEIHSTASDSIQDFIKRCKKANLKIQ